MLYERLLRPIAFRLDAERAHEIALSLLARRPAAAALAACTPLVQDPVEIRGVAFRNRLGLAAGFDKDARALRGWRALGFGFVEVGTVTRFAQPGNPRPRIFRCPEERALINRLGFPNEGAEAMARRLEAWRREGAVPGFPVGINIGKSKRVPLEEAREDYLATFRRLYALGDFFVVNVSSPNTPGLRDLQSPEGLRPVLRALIEHADAEAQRKPVLVKIAPDLDEAGIAAIIDLVTECGADGIVATNTTVDHTGVSLEETGGLSGAPLRARSTGVLRFIARETKGELPLVGVGGVFDRRDYLEKLDAGAWLVEMYTGLVYGGPRVVPRVLAGDVPRVPGPEGSPSSS